MRTVTFKRNPVTTSTTQHAGSVESHLQSYKLIAQRLQWQCDSETTQCNESNLNSYIGKLLDPIAFESGHTEISQEIQDAAKEAFSASSWAGEPFSLKTIVRNTGRNGGLFKRKKQSVLSTFALYGEKRESLTTTVEVPPQDGEWVEASRVLRDWQKEYNQLLDSLDDNAVFLLQIEPTENDSKFKIGMEFDHE